jgi:hypothetical protein
MMSMMVGIAAFGVAVSSQAQVTNFTWTGTAGDGDWNNAGNWDANGVPVDSFSDTGLSFNNPSNKIVFAGATLPTSNIPDIGGTAAQYKGGSVGDAHTPAIELLSGGTLSLTTGVGSFSGFFTDDPSLGRTIFTVGDGVGGAEDVVLNVAHTGYLNRHQGPFHNFTVKSDGALNFVNTATHAPYDKAGRHATFTIDGGSVSFASDLKNFAGFEDNYADLIGVGSTFTAKFGNDFTNLATVEAEIGDAKTFRSSTALAVVATDNGDGTFTVEAQTPPSDITVASLDAAAAEGGSDPGTFRIARGLATSGNLDVYYTLSGTADASDYTESHTAPVTIPDGSSFVDLTFTPVDDAVMEGDESIVLAITPDASYTVGSVSTGTITIAENDFISVQALDAAAAEEGSDPGTFRISRGALTNGTLEVYFTISGTADASDYTESYTSPLTIPDGVNSVDLVFTPVDDADLEDNEDIVLTITPDASYVVGAANSGTITIADNEVPTYTWTGATDGDWNNAANWDAAGVPVDNLPSGSGNTGLSCAPGTLIILDGPLPASNIPALGGYFRPNKVEDTPNVWIKHDGSISLTLSEIWKNVTGSTNDVITVGDGDGSAGEVTVTLNSSGTSLQMARHDNNTLNIFKVNKDGILNLTMDTVYFGLNATASRDGKMIIDGGEVTLSGIVTNMIADAERVVEFTAVGGSFSASYGGDFPDYTAVTNALGTKFINSAGALEVTDNTTSFTVSVVSGAPVSIPVQAVGGDLVIDSILNASYIVESKLDLVNDPTWTVYTNMTGDGSTIVIPMSTDKDQEFYRAFEVN